MKRWRLRIEFWGDEIERILEFDPLTGEVLIERTEVNIYPAKHFITSDEKLAAAIMDIEEELQSRVIELQDEGKIVEAQRIQQRTRYDLEMLQETGYCSGVENYSRHLSRRQAGEQPWTLLDYFPDDFLLMVDESHITLPQVRGMFGGDRARKVTLIDYGFRLPSAADNRPLTFHGVRGPYQPGGVRERHARPVRVRAQRADSRADHSPHRPG